MKQHAQQKRKKECGVEDVSNYHELVVVFLALKTCEKVFQTFGTNAVKEKKHSQANWLSLMMVGKIQSYSRIGFVAGLY